MNWLSFGIAFFIVVIVPVWIIRLTDISFILRIIFTVVGGIVCFWAVNKGGAKRGFFTR